MNLTLRHREVQRDYSLVLYLRWEDDCNWEKNNREKKPDEYNVREYELRQYSTVHTEVVA